MKPKKILPTLAAFVIASGSTDAAFIYHDSAITTGGTFSGFPIGNLSNSGHTSHLDTENGSDASESYATANPPTGGYPATITLDFTSAMSLDTFYLWNHTNNGGGGAPNAGMGSFTLTFFDAVTGGGSQIGSVFSGEAAAAPTATGTYAAEIFALGSTYAGVRSVELTVTDRADNTSASFFAIRELGFNQVPEPSTTALLGLGGLTLILRRSKQTGFKK